MSVQKGGRKTFNKFNPPPPPHPLNICSKISYKPMEIDNDISANHTLLKDACIIQRKQFLLKNLNLWGCVFTIVSRLVRRRQL